MPVVTQIDENTIKPLLTSAKGKPRLINFWATWCTPCVEEFPLLVKAARRLQRQTSKSSQSPWIIPVERTREVPKFLKELNATMPAYLLYTKDEDAVISSISKDWKGGLPFTVLYNSEGKPSFVKQGLLKDEEIRAEILKAMPLEECKGN